MAVLMPITVTTNAVQVFRQITVASGRAFRSVLDGVSRAGKGIQRLTALVTRLGHSLTMITSHFTRAAVGLTANFLMINSTLEQLEVMMSTALGSKSAGAKGLESLLDMATKMPFAIDAIAASFAKLTAAGVEQTERVLTVMVDAVAAFGGTSEDLKLSIIAIQQMVGKGVISMEELRRQLSERIPTAIPAMARGLKIEIGELITLIETGTLDYAKGMNAMLREFENMYSGAAIARMNTFAGAVVYFQVQWAVLMRRIGESNASFTSITGLIRQVADAIGDVRTSARGLVIIDYIGESIVDMLAPLRENPKMLKEYFEIALIAVGKTVTVVAELTVEFVRFLQWISDNKEEIKAFFSDLVSSVIELHDFSNRFINTWQAFKDMPKIGVSKYFSLTEEEQRAYPKLRDKYIELHRLQRRLSQAYYFNIPVITTQLSDQITALKAEIAEILDGSTVQAEDGGNNFFDRLLADFTNFADKRKNIEAALADPDSEENRRKAQHEGDIFEGKAANERLAEVARRQKFEELITSITGTEAEKRTLKIEQEVRKRAKALSLTEEEVKTLREAYTLARTPKVKEDKRSLEIAERLTADLKRLTSDREEFERWEIQETHKTLIANYSEHEELIKAVTAAKLASLDTIKEQEREDFLAKVDHALMTDEEQRISVITEKYSLLIQGIKELGLESTRAAAYISALQNKLDDLLNVSEPVVPEGFFEGMMAGWDELLEKQRSTADMGADFLMTSMGALEEAWSDTFFNVIMGDFDSIGEAWENLMTGMLRKFTDIMVEMAMQDIMKSSTAGSGWVGAAVKFVGGLFPGIMGHEAITDDMFANPHRYSDGGLLKGGSGVRDDLYLGKVGGRAILAKGGEYIINPKSTKKHLPLIQAINADTFSKGGLVGANNIAAPEITVNVHEAEGTKATVEQDGNDINVVIEQLESAIQGRMDRGTGLASFMDNRYGRAF